MTWTRLPDCNGFARWRCVAEPPRFGGQILASPRVGLIVACDGIVVCAESSDELEAGLARLLERLEWAAYRDLLAAVREAWDHVGHKSLAAAPVRTATPPRVRPVAIRWEVQDFEAREATG